MIIMKKKEFIQGIALDRIYVLFKLAKKDKKRSKKYVGLALKIGKRNRVRIPQELKKSFCKNCHSYLDSKNSKKRIQKTMLKVMCLECNTVKKIGLKQKRKKM